MKKNNRRLQHLVKYLVLCMLILSVNFIVGGKTVHAKLSVSGDKSLIKVSKCSQTFDGTKDLVIWVNPAKFKKGIEIIHYFDGADGGICNTIEYNYKSPWYIKSMDKNGKIVLRKEALIEFNDGYGDMNSNPYKGHMSYSIYNGKNSADVDVDYNLTKIKNKKFTITYDTKGGNKIKSQSVRLFGKFPNIKPTRKGYAFIGWREKNNYDN